MGLTNDQIQIKLNSLEKKIAELTIKIDDLTSDISSRTRVSDVANVQAYLTSLITDSNEAISSLEQRLGKVLLPEETRFYLEEGEVEAFKSNFSKLRAMLARFEKLYNNLVAYTVTNK